VVEVKSSEDYDAWLTEQHELTAKAADAEKASLSASMSKEELMQLGETTYMAYCAACHQPTGLGLPPTFPALKGSAVATTGPVTDHIALVLHGKNMMPPFGKQLSLQEIAAVITYERNSWGNDTGDLVQSSDVKAASEE
jgi:cytochrome c oxidase subunit 2